MSHPRTGPVDPYIDFTDLYDDDGFVEASISRVIDGEPFRATTVGDCARRVPDVLRRRLERIRDFADDMLWMRDADRALGLFTPSAGTNATWNGTVADGGDGKFTLSNDLWIGPFLTAGNDANTPPVGAYKGAATLLRDDAAPLIIVTSLLDSAAGGDKITIEVVAGGAFSYTETDGHIRIVAPPGTTRDTVGLAFVLPPSAFVTIAFAGGTAGTDLIDIPQAKQRLAGNTDAEIHVVTPANLAAFFASPANVLSDGDTVALWYAALIEGGGNGGRRQSTPENGNTAVSAGTIFNSRVFPDRMINAVPIAKVMGGRLVFINGASIPKGVTVVVGGSSAGTLTYAGGPAWLDGTTNPATTVEGQLDKIISDLILNASPLSDGAAKIGAAAVAAAGLGAGSIRDQLTALAVIDVIPTWLDGDTNPDTTKYLLLKSIIADLSLNTAAICGASKVGSEAISQMPRGSVRSQLTYLLQDRVAGHVAPGLYAASTSDNTFDVEPFSAVINGVNRSLLVTTPVSSVGKTPNTHYYCYAAWNGTQVVLSLDTAAPDVFTRVSGADPTKTYLFSVLTCPTTDKMRSFIRRNRRTFLPITTVFGDATLPAFSYVNDGAAAVLLDGSLPNVSLNTVLPPTARCAHLFAQPAFGAPGGTLTVKSNSSFGAHYTIAVDTTVKLYVVGWHQPAGTAVGVSVTGPGGSGFYLGCDEYED